MMLAAETPSLEKLLNSNVSIFGTDVPLLLIAGVVIAAIVVLRRIDTVKSAAFKRKQMIDQADKGDGRRFEIEHHASDGRKVCKAMFWLTGIGFGIIYLISESSLKVGVFWLGCLLLFGIGALLSKTTSTMFMLAPPTPDPREQRYDYSSGHEPR